MKKLKLNFILILISFFLLNENLLAQSTCSFDLVRIEINDDKAMATVKAFDDVKYPKLKLYCNGDSSEIKLPEYLKRGQLLNFKIDRLKCDCTEDIKYWISSTKCSQTKVLSKEFCTKNKEVSEKNNCLLEITRIEKVGDKVRINVKALEKIEASELIIYCHRESIKFPLKKVLNKGETQTLYLTKSQCNFSEDIKLEINSSKCKLKRTMTINFDTDNSVDPSPSNWICWLLGFLVFIYFLVRLLLIGANSTLVIPGIGTVVWSNFWEFLGGSIAIFIIAKCPCPSAILGLIGIIAASLVIGFDYSREKKIFEEWASAIMIAIGLSISFIFIIVYNCN